MLNRTDLINQLADAKLKSTDTVLIHSSMKAIGNIDANVVIDVLMDYFKDGLLIMPTHTWAHIKNDYDTFNVNDTPGNVGILPEIFRQRPNVYRSLHPTHSVAAFGKDAKTYIQNEENMVTPCNPQGVYGKLYARDAKILLIGVNHIKNTYIHSVEESFNVANRISDKDTIYNIITNNHKTIQGIFRRHFCSLHPHVSECYEKLEPIFVAEGVEQIASFGQARMLVCSAQGIYQTLAKLFKFDKQLLVEYDKIPLEAQKHL